MGFPKTYKEVGVTKENRPNHCLHDIALKC